MPLGQGKRSSAIRPSEWQRHREKICELYETKSLEKVQAVMLKHHEFAPTLSQYKRQLSLWKVSKNRRRPEAEDAGLPHEPTEMAEKNEDFEDTYVRLFLLSIVGVPFYWIGTINDYCRKIARPIVYGVQRLIPSKSSDVDSTCPWTVPSGTIYKDSAPGRF